MNLKTAHRSVLTHHKIQKETNNHEQYLTHILNSDINVLVANWREELM